MSEQSSSEIVGLSQEAHEQFFPTRGYATTDYGYIKFKLQNLTADGVCGNYACVVYINNMPVSQHNCIYDQEGASVIITPGEVPLNIIKESKTSFPRQFIVNSRAETTIYRFAKRERNGQAALYNYQTHNNLTGCLINEGSKWFGYVQLQLIFEGNIEP